MLDSRTLDELHLVQRRAASTLARSCHDDRRCGSVAHIRPLCAVASVTWLHHAAHRCKIVVVTCLPQGGSESLRGIGARTMRSAPNLDQSIRTGNDFWSLLWFGPVRAPECRLSCRTACTGPVMLRASLLQPHIGERSRNRHWREGAWGSASQHAAGGRTPRPAPSRWRRISVSAFVWAALCVLRRPLRARRLRRPIEFELWPFVIVPDPGYARDPCRASAGCRSGAQRGPFWRPMSGALGPGRRCGVGGSSQTCPSAILCEGPGLRDRVRTGRSAWCRVWETSPVGWPLQTMCLGEVG